VKIVFAGQHLIPYESFFERQRRLIERWRDHLVFLGVLEDGQAMADFYAACDVLALSSDTECFALVQVEAMLCGTPVVMTDAPGGRTAVRATGMGEVVPRGDWRALGDAIVRVLRERGRYLRPAAEVSARYDIEASIDAYERLFTRVASGADGRRAAAG
jgi:glycosyltransferase involved in cell wall biosynthesis